jgi:hypothetical protein
MRNNQNRPSFSEPKEAPGEEAKPASRAAGRPPQAGPPAGLADKMPPGKEEKRSGIVTLITDFGTQGEYAGALKGSILSVNPRCRVVDITHEIPPQDILRASFVLRHSYPYFPNGTVHLTVVDPGVGTGRRALVLRKGRHLFVGPDNGVFTEVLSGPGEAEARAITRENFFRRPPSATFHGRDLFGPVAGRLSAGLPLREFGPRVSDPVRAGEPLPQREGTRLTGRVLWADSFGNLLTNIGEDEYGPVLGATGWRISGRGWRIETLSRTYGEGKRGQPLALFGSSGRLELAVNRDRAADLLGLKPGDPVVIRFRKGKG